MSRKLSLLLVLIVLTGGQTRAQQFPPGYVDPEPLLAAASNAIDEQSLHCVTFSGTGYSGPVGQTFENAVNVDWPRSEMANYTRTTMSSLVACSSSTTARLPSPRGRVFAHDAVQRRCIYWFPDRNIHRSVMAPRALRLPPQASKREWFTGRLDPED
jgi:hypothetical protein